MGGPGYLGGGTVTGGYSVTENLDSKTVAKISQNVDTTHIKINITELSYVLDMVEALVEQLSTHSPVWQRIHNRIVLDGWVVASGYSH